jgi:hypothetical protein
MGDSRPKIKQEKGRRGEDVFKNNVSPFLSFSFLLLALGKRRM